MLLFTMIAHLCYFVWSNVTVSLEGAGLRLESDHLLPTIFYHPMIFTDRETTTSESW